jgi:hypothetical protein
MNFSYVAGFIDGDGSFEFTIRRRQIKKIRKHYSYWEPMFITKIEQKTATGYEAMNKMAQFLKESGIKCGLYPRKSHYKGKEYLRTAIHIPGHSAQVKLIEHIKDELIVKKLQAEVFLALLKEVMALERGSGFGGQKYTATVCISLLERWDKVRVRLEHKRTWDVERIKTFSA